MSSQNKQESELAKGIRRQSKEPRVKEFIDNYVYRIDLDADYQREKVWSKEDQIKLLDSMLRDIDIPKIYLAEVKNNKQFDYECIDGKQRMLTILEFYDPDKREKSPLQIKVFSAKYTYTQLQNEHPTLAKKLDDYKLHFIIYNRDDIDDEFLRDIFRRLQLGIRLNSGEKLNSFTGAMRDFVYKKIGKDGPFLRNTKLSDKRYSRQYTLAQICINSFNRALEGNFVRARLPDIEYFFEENSKLEANDPDLSRIRDALNIMDEKFGKRASIISSRAVAVSAYLFIEGLSMDGKTGLIPPFVNFFIGLLNKIKHNMKLLKDYKEVENKVILDEFQKYILQASVESNSIKRRNEFLKKAFDHYLNPNTKGKIIGSN